MRSKEREEWVRLTFLKGGDRIKRGGVCFYWEMVASIVEKREGKGGKIWLVFSRNGGREGQEDWASRSRRNFQEAEPGERSTRRGKKKGKEENEYYLPSINGRSWKREKGGRNRAVG